MEDCHKLDHPLASEEELLDQEEVLLGAGVDLVLESYMNPMFLPFTLISRVMVDTVKALAFNQSSQSLLLRTVFNQYGECFSFCEEEIVASF